MARVERLSPEDDEQIRLVASAVGMSVSTFVVSRARAAAEEVLGDRAHFFLDADAWDALQRRLSQPPAFKPGLARLLAEPGVKQPDGTAGQPK